jgi:hypothetical protein
MADDKKKMPDAEPDITMSDMPVQENATDVNPDLVAAVTAAVMQSPIMKQLEELLNELNEMKDGEEEEDEAKMPPSVAPEAAKFNEPPPVKMEAGMGSGTDTFTPSMVKPKAKENYQMSDETKIKYEALETRLNAVEAENSAIKALNEKIVIQAKQEHAARQYEALKAEGYEVEEDDLKLMANMEVSSQKKHAEIIRKKYKKAPVKGGLQDLVQYARPTGEDVSSANLEAIADFAFQNGLNFEQAKAKYNTSK